MDEPNVSGALATIHARLKINLKKIKTCGVFKPVAGVPHVGSARVFTRDQNPMRNRIGEDTTTKVIQVVNGPDPRSLDPCKTRHPIRMVSTASRHGSRGTLFGTTNDRPGATRWAEMNIRTKGRLEDLKKQCLS